jgi:hypothetical protein
VAINTRFHIQDVPMTQILVDGITNISLHNGLVRVECATVGPDGKQHPSGTLVIPGAAAGKVLQTLINGAQELEKKLREQQAQQQATAGNA